MKEQILAGLLGGHTLPEFLGFIFWALVGAYLLVSIHAHTRNAMSYRTPVNFSWLFWFQDNVRRVFFNLVCIIVALRFSKDVSGHEVNDWWAFLIGFSSDGIAIGLTKFKLWQLIGTSDKAAVAAGSPPPPGAPIPSPAPGGTL